MKKVKIGIIPVRRDSMLRENALKNKIRFSAEIVKIKDEAVDYVDIEDICEDGMMISDLDQMEAIEKKMKDQNVDGIFFPHMDFGTEESVGKLGRHINKPTLLWGSRDAECGTFYRAPIDIQCGLFASSKALVRNNVKFSYIENSYPESELFKNGFDKFCRTASVVRSFNKMRIGQVGLRPKQFHSVIYNEDDIMNKFGVEIIPLSVMTIVNKAKSLIAENDENVLYFAQEYRQRMKCSMIDDNGIKNLSALKHILLSYIKEYKLDAISLECWSAFVGAFGTMVCVVVGDITGMGFPVACETDTMGAITSIMLHNANYAKQATFFADLTVRHNENDNAILLWHCGPFCEELKAKDEKSHLVYGTGTWKLKDGDITLARLDGTGGKYSLTFDEGKSCEGARPNGNYIWYETEDYKKFEEKFIFGPYIHHVACSYGNYARVLHESTKYLKDIESDPIFGIKYLGLS